MIRNLRIVCLDYDVSNLQLKFSQEKLATLKKSQNQFGFDGSTKSEKCSTKITLHLLIKTGMFRKPKKERHEVEDAKKFEKIDATAKSEALPFQMRSFVCRR